MKLSIERLPESRVQLDIAADEAEFSQAMDRAFRKVAREIALPGFRKGKAPRAMVERAYGRGAFLEEANRDLMNDLYRRAVEQEDLSPVGDPEVELVAAEPLAFKVTIPVYPAVDAGDYAAVRVEPVDAAIDQAAVDDLVERLRRDASPWVDPADEGMELGGDKVLRPKRRTPRAGDQVTIDYSVMMGDEQAEAPQTDAVFVVGESGLLEPVEEQITRLAVGETATFDVSFAEDDAAIEAGLRGKTLTYTVTLKGLKERELVPLDDDFAKSLGEVETLDELRGNVRDNLHRERTSEARSEVLNAIVDAMLAGATFEVPAAMVDRTVEEDIQGMRRRLANRGISLEGYLRATEQSEEQLREELRPEAERRLRRSLLLREVAKREGIAVDDADLDAAVEEMVSTTPAARDPEQMASFYRSDTVRGVLRDDLFERRLFDRLVEIATEGRGAVTNGWEPSAAPEASEAEENGEEPVAATEPASAGGESSLEVAGANGLDDGAAEPTEAAADERAVAERAAAPE